MNKANAKGIRTKVLVPLSLALLVVFVASFFGMRRAMHMHIKDDVRTCLNRTEQIFRMELDESAKLLNSRIDLLEGDRKLQQAWLAQDANMLAGNCREYFEDMRDKYKVTHFYFHTLERVCFLRVHKPSRRGDLIERFTLREAAGRGEPVHGIELGPLGTFTLRAVRPWQIDGELAGYIELGIDMEHLSGHIKQVADNELIVVIEKKHLNRSDWEQGNKMLGREGNWDQFSEAVVTESTMDHIPAGVGKYLEHHFDEHDKYVFGVSVNGKKYMGGFIPLHDAGGQEVGEIVCLDDVTGAELSARVFSAAVVAVALVISGLILWFFYIMLGRMETNLAAAQDELEARVHEKERIESQLRGQKERLKEEVWTRREAEGKLEEQVNELARAREAALNMMEDAESAKEQAEQARAELERANLQLEAAAEHANVLAQEALVANRTKSEFLANMSHEIRSPMNAVIGFSDILAEEKLTEEQKQHVDLIRESGRHLMEIINDILDFSKVEAGKLDTELTECSLGKLINSVGSLMRAKAREKGIEFQIVEGQGLPGRIRTDPVRLRQCLINLVGNAIKFTDQGHVHVNVGLHDRDGTPWICFDVEDTGMGIPADKQDTIFEAFTQADSGTTRRFGGTGLGLAITRRLTGLLGGKLTLSSEVGKGSVFSLVIPAGVDVTKQPFLDRHNLAAQAAAKGNKSQPAKFSGRVLVAEDSRTNQMLAKLLLEKMGFDVTVAQDGNEAVQKALSRRFELILMDVQMPNMNGIEATKALRSKSVTTPIVALTAHAMRGDAEKCLAAGCDDYLAKPINHEQLLKTIAKYVPVKNGDLSKRIDSVKSEVEQLGRLCSETRSPDVEESEHSGADTGQPSQS